MGDFPDYAPTFRPDKHPVLYHYCSTNTFLNIIQRRCLWLSDVNTMNDYGEMHWSYRLFVEAANTVLKTVGTDFVEEVDDVVHNAQTRLLPMLGAFSTDGDVLSQWRAYAEDGSGVAIGFNSKQIANLSIRIASIEYSRDKQIAHFSAWLLAIHALYKNMPEAKRRDFLFNEGTQLSMDMAFFKNPSFAEEKEVRILRSVVVNQDDNSWGLRDSGGNGERISGKKLPVLYRAAKNGGVVSYMEIPLKGLGNDLITEIVVGPKSPNNGIEISMALNAAGFTGHTVRKSLSTYR